MVTCSFPDTPPPPRNAPLGRTGRQRAITMAIWTQIPYTAVRCDWRALRWDGTKCQSNRVFFFSLFLFFASGLQGQTLRSDYRDSWSERWTWQVDLTTGEWRGGGLIKAESRSEAKIKQNVFWTQTSLFLVRLYFWPDLWIQRTVSHIYVKSGCISRKHKSFLFSTNISLNLCIPFSVSVGKSVISDNKATFWTKTVGDVVKLKIDFRFMFLPYATLQIYNVEEKHSALFVPLVGPVMRVHALAI